MQQLPGKTHFTAGEGLTRLQEEQSGPTDINRRDGGNTQERNTKADPLVRGADDPWSVRNTHETLALVETQDPVWSTESETRYRPQKKKLCS